MDKQKLLYWLPRVLGILYILFISLFSLDVFGMGLDFWDTLAALFMHLIPSFILAALLAAAWKLKRLGAIIFAAASIILLAVYLLPGNNYQNPMVIASAAQLFIPLFLTAYLFWIQSNKNN